MVDNMELKDWIGPVPGASEDSVDDGEGRLWDSERPRARKSGTPVWRTVALDPVVWCRIGRGAPSWKRLTLLGPSLGPC